MPPYLLCHQGLIRAWPSILVVSVCLACSDPAAPDGSSSAQPQTDRNVVLAFVGGSDQSVEVDATAPNPIVVRATGRSGEPRAGIAVTLSASSQGARLRPGDSQTTSSDGLASFRFKTPRTAGVLTLDASAPNAERVTTTIDVRPAEAVSLDLQLGTPLLRNGEITRVQIASEDRFGNQLGPSDVDLRVHGTAASVTESGQLQGVKPGASILVAQSAALADSVSFTVYGEVWRHSTTSKPVSLFALASGEYVLLTRTAVELRDAAGRVKLSAPVPADPGDLAVDEGRRTAFVSLTGAGGGANMLKVDLTTGAWATWASGLRKVGHLSYDAVTQTLITVDQDSTACIMDMATGSSSFRKVGFLPLTSAIDPYARVALVSNHSTWDASLLYLDRSGEVRISAGPTPFAVGVDTVRHIGIVSNAMGPFVTLVDLASGQKLGDVYSGSWPNEVAVDHQKGLAIVQHTFGRVAWLDLATQAVVASMDYGHPLLGIRAGLEQRVAFITPDPADRLYVISFDEARSLPDLLPSGTVVEAAAVAGGPFVAIATANPPGLELQRLPITSPSP